MRRIPRPARRNPMAERSQSGVAPSAELLPLVYGELQRMATWAMAREAPGHTLQPAALVHEAYLRLLQRGQARWKSRQHFCNAAVQAMRRILVEQARHQCRLKRGGHWKRVPLDDLPVAGHAESESLLVVEEALERLRIVDRFKAELVKLRFFIGLDNKELARALEVSEPTIKRHWRFARAWLYQELKRIQNE